MGMPNPDYLTAAEACHLLGVHQSTVSRMVIRGELTPVVRGPGVRGVHFFRRRDVERLAACRASRVPPLER